MGSTIGCRYQLQRWLVGWCLTALSAPTVYSVPWVYEIVGLGAKYNKTINQIQIKHSLTWSFSPVMISWTRVGFLRGVFLANHLASIDN